MTSITKRPWLFLLLAALAGLAMLFAACGGGDDDDDSGGDGTTATATADEGDDGGDDDGDDGDDETPEATEDDGDGDDGGDDDDSDNPFDALADLTDEPVTGKVTYETTDTEDGTVSILTLYSDAENNRSRYDSVSSVGGMFVIITTTEASYTCTASEDGDDGVCFESEGTEDATALGLFGFFASPALLAAYVDTLAGIDVSESNEEIAGVDARCFSWEGEIEGESGSGKVCLASSGQMLSADFESSDGTGSHMIATDVSDDVSDSDFEPPYPPLEIPGQ